MEIIDIKEQGLKEFGEQYTQALAQSMQQTKSVLAANILRKSMTPIYKIHMHSKKDWRVLKLLSIRNGFDSNNKYETVSTHKSYKEAQAIMKLLED